MTGRARPALKPRADLCRCHLKRLKSMDIPSTVFDPRKSLQNWCSTAGTWCQLLLCPLLSSPCSQTRMLHAYMPRKYIVIAQAAASNPGARLSQPCLQHCHRQCCSPVCRSALHVSAACHDSAAPAVDKRLPLSQRPPSQAAEVHACLPPRHAATGAAGITAGWIGGSRCHASPAAGPRCQLDITGPPLTV